MTALQRWSNGLMNTPFTGLINEMFRDLDYATPRAWSAPSADVQETDDAFVIYCDAPGVDPKDINVQIEGDTLRVKAERKSDRRFVSYSRSFVVPRDVDTGNIDAAYEHGVLVLRLPKREDARSRTIEVKVKD